MEIDRRTLLAGGLATLVAAPSVAQRRAAGPGWYDRAVIIDALGGLSDPYTPEDQLRIGDRAWTEMVESGVTLLRDTVFPVGNVADPWGDYRKDIEAKHHILTANPDRLILVRSAADILKAKRERKFAWLYGTQDTSMVGGDLDRLAQMKKDGVMTVQLTYNNGNLAGDGSLEPRNGGVTKLGSRARNCCSISATAVRGRWPRQRPWQSARWSSATPARGRSSITPATPVTRRSRPSPTRGVSSASIGCRS
jgi:membrane dipeptidase